MQLTTVVAWIPRGKCAERPRRCELTDVEYARSAGVLGIDMAATEREIATKLREEDAGSDDNIDAHAGGAEAESAAKPTDSSMDVDMDAGADSEDNFDDLKEFNLENYDDEDEEDDDAICTAGVFGELPTEFEAKRSAKNAGAKRNKAAKHVNDDNLDENDDDDDDDDADDGDEDDEDDDENDEFDEQELEDLMIRRSDCVLCVGAHSDGISTVEMKVCELPDDSEQEPWSLYTHHDILVPSMPLAIEHIPKRPGCLPSAAGGNSAFVAVAGMDPHIEIWDLDMIDSIAPLVVLGDPHIATRLKKSAAAAAAQKRKRPGKSSKPKPSEIDLSTVDSHTDSILSLSWNTLQHELLASGSADGCVRIWDLNVAKTTSCHRKLHQGHKVCGVLWSPAAPTCLLTAGHDSIVQFCDIRATENDSVRIKLDSAHGDPECVIWDTAQSDGSRIFVMSESGAIRHYDLRSPANPLWHLDAHDGSGGLSMRRDTPLLASVGKDAYVKVWDVSGAQPSSVLSRKLNLDELFGCSWCPDGTGLLAVAGLTGSIVFDYARREQVIPNELPDGRDDSESGGEEDNYGDDD